MSDDPQPDKHVLIVDNEALLRTFYTTALSRRGYATTGAANGTEALLALHTAHYDLIIADLHMAPIDGRELLNKLHRGHPPLILVTGDTTATKPPGAAALLYKPFSIDELTSTVAAVMLHKASDRASAAPR